MTLEFSRHIFEKYTNIKCNQNPFIESRFVSFARTDRWTDGQRDTKKLIVAFSILRNATKR